MANDGGEPLIPSRTTLSFAYPNWRHPWTIVALLSTIVFIAQIVPSQSTLLPPGRAVFWATHPAFYEIQMAFLAITASLQIGIAAAIWIALVRPSWSDRLLWSAATTMSAFVIITSIPDRWHVQHFAAIAMIGFGAWAVVAWHSSMPRFLRILLVAACAIVAGYALFVPSILGLAPLYQLGTPAIACAIWFWSLATTTHFGVDVFDVRD